MMPCDGPNYPMRTSPEWGCLLLRHRPPEGGRPVVTIENKSKVYWLVVVHGVGDCTFYGLDELDEYWKEHEGPAYCDHAPNPSAVECFAVDHGFDIDYDSWLSMVGRWECEHHGRYDRNLFDRPEAT